MKYRIETLTNPMSQSDHPNIYDVETANELFKTIRSLGVCCDVMMDNKILFTSYSISFCKNYSIPITIKNCTKHYLDCRLDCHDE